MSKKKAVTESSVGKFSAPYWTYPVAAIIGIAGLYFTWRSSTKNQSADMTSIVTQSASANKGTAINANGSIVSGNSRVSGIPTSSSGPSSISQNAEASNSATAVNAQNSAIELNRKSSRK